jgi:nucleoside-diphosphate-sugar epimerase
MQSLVTEDQLLEALSRPTEAAVEAMRLVEGDLIILGAGGKMGPTLARMARRAFDALGQTGRRVIAVSRFSSPMAEAELTEYGVEVIRCDLLNLVDVQSLPQAPNVIFMAGQKFGTSDSPHLTWAMNTLTPAYVAQKYAQSRIVVFSTGCVYPLMPLEGRGAREDDALTPLGEYANSCVGRERLFGHFALQNNTPMLFFRLCYAIDLRYGVLHDIAQKVDQNQPVDVSMGAVHVIWQGDANARALQCLSHTTHPPSALNITGMERVAVRDLAQRFGQLLGKEPQFTGNEQSHAWVWDASRSYELFGPPSVSLDEMIQATAEWLKIGGTTLGKPTHFEVTSGTF